MSLLVVGSVALDNIETPFGKARDVLGGSAVHFALAASLFTGTRIVGVVGRDFPKRHFEFLASKGIDVGGIKAAEGRTFRWSGRYAYSLNEAETLSTELNVLENFRPELPKGYKGTKYVFLANIDPELQLEVLRQVDAPRLVACDTMNYWINSKKAKLKKLLKKADIFILNDGEARQLSGDANLFKAARAISLMGPGTVIIKKGEHGSLMLRGDTVFMAPAYPLEAIADPTGAGDSFAGGFMGSLSRNGRHDNAALRKAVMYGTIAAAFDVEAFGTKRFNNLKRCDIQRRFKEFESCIRF